MISQNLIVDKDGHELKKLLLWAEIYKCIHA